MDPGADAQQPARPCKTFQSYAAKLQVNEIETVIASAFPAACGGVSERIKIDPMPFREDSFPLEVGSFNSSGAGLIRRNRRPA